MAGAETSRNGSAFLFDGEAGRGGLASSSALPSVDLEETRHGLHLKQISAKWRVSIIDSLVRTRDADVGMTKINIW